jgi:hypothetical protein
MLSGNEEVHMHSIFAVMVDHNKNSIYFCLSKVDIKSLVDECLEFVPDWEGNFRALQAKNREPEKLPRHLHLHVCLLHKDA